MDGCGHGVAGTKVSFVVQPQTHGDSLILAGLQLIAKDQSFVKVIIYPRLTQNCNSPVTRSECVEVFDQKRTFLVVSIVITVRMWC